MAPRSEANDNDAALPTLGGGSERYVSVSGVARRKRQTTVICLAAAASPRSAPRLPSKDLVVTRAVRARNGPRERDALGGAISAAGHGKRSAGPVTVHFEAPDSLRLWSTAGRAGRRTQAWPHQCGQVTPYCEGPSDGYRLHRWAHVGKEAKSPATSRRQKQPSMRSQCA